MSAETVSPSLLLIRPLCEGDDPEFAEPLGIERLAGYLRAHGVGDVQVVDRRLPMAERRAGTVRLDAPGFFDELLDSYPAGVEPKVVGISLMTSADVPDARRIFERLHAHWPDALFVAGGGYITSALEEASRMLPSYVGMLAGEGEATLLALACGEPACGARGSSGARGSTGMAAASDLESAPSRLMVAGGLPSPDEWAFAYRPHLERYAALGCAVNIQSARGCPGSCTFCATPSLPHHLRRWQPRDMRLVVDEVEHEAERLTAAGLPPVFNFVDDDFGPLERLELLASELDARRLRVAYACEMRLAALAGQQQLASRLKHLHKSGLTRVFFGVESLNRETLARWRKPVDVGVLPEVIGAFRDAGIAVQAGYILWHGCQTVKGACEEVERLRELGLYTHRSALSRLIVFPGCELAGEGTTQGFQPMAPEAEEFYQRFSDAASDLTEQWTKAAIDEPYAAAVAFLTGDDANLAEIKRTLSSVNARSYELFSSMG